ncbi:hypothetical protein SIN57_001952, partial [Campylobacter upsaliensis]|nr:hypothetical protein [Campylobacter upsaliensis]
MALSQPHGGKLINLYDPKFDVSELKVELEIDTVALSDLELIGNGAYSPLTGFLSQKDYEAVVENMHLSTGEVWSIPITLPISQEQ